MTYHDHFYRLGPGRSGVLRARAAGISRVPGGVFRPDPRGLCAWDLRKFASWCHRHHLALFSVRRADIECFGRDLEAAGRARATVTRRLCTIAGFYRYAVEEDLLAPPRRCTSGGRGWTTS